MQSAGKRGEKEKSEVYASDFFVHNGRGEDKLSSEAVRNARKAGRGRTKQPRKPSQKKRRNNAESRVMLKAEEMYEKKEKSGAYASDFFVHNGRGEDRLSSEAVRKARKAERGRTKQPKTAAKEKAT